jgi:hypothetical protein
VPSAASVDHTTKFRRATPIWTTVSSSIPFNRPPITGRELSLLKEAIERRELSGDGYFMKQCEAWPVKHLGVVRALLTHSCTAPFMTLSFVLVPLRLTVFLGIALSPTQLFGLGFFVAGVTLSAIAR